FKEATILNAFKATGLSPFNPDVILDRFNTNPTTRPSSSESSMSYDSRACQLSQTLHTMAVKSQLLQHENEQLQEALINKRKRRQRGKFLLLQATEEYHGGAVFWSPTKVQDARDRQAQKKDDERLQKEQ
ncbi:hypothetical protein K505DRAFT_199252, partial [Melanomma pulvis-pyrius CBS 109.77]